MQSVQQVPSLGYTAFLGLYYSYLDQHFASFGLPPLPTEHCHLMTTPNRSFFRFLGQLAISALTFLIGSQASSGTDWDTRNEEFSKSIEPLLQKYCLGCHSGAQAESGLALNHFKDAREVFRQRAVWEGVAKRMEIGDMPPADAPQPSKEESARMTQWIRSTLNDIDCGKTPNPGAVTLRRINRIEYRNSIRDLFRIDYEPSANFPGDDVGYGFDNIGDVLTLPPLLMEKYVRAAEEISQQVIIAPAQGPVFDSPRKISQLTADTGGNFEGSRFVFFSNGKITFEEQAPWTGRYTLELGMAGSAAEGRFPKVILSIDGKKVEEVTVETDSPNTPKTFTIPIRMRAGKRVFELNFANDHYVPAKDGQPPQDTNLYIYDLRLTGQKPAEKVPQLALPEIHRELVRDATPTATRSVAESAKDVMRRVASRAYRRPATDDELNRLATIVEQSVAAGESYEAGLQTAVAAVLVSPHFLFKIEEPSHRIAGEYPLLSEFELATRMSYFLWSSTPDRELLSLASKKQLREPGVLAAQLDRMLRDDRARDFVRNFAGQWLTLRKLDQFTPNAGMFPDWNDSLRESMRTESYYLFLYILRENMSVLRLLDADFSFMNESLARYYQIPGISGEKFQKVSLKGHKRMGILTHASVLAVTSNPTRTSPVKRGKWILDNILGTPPPPAPPGVPELEKGELTGTLREQLEQHRANPSCAACHKQMDPIGLALENYDAVGRWRTEERGAPIDASGELPTGEVIKNPADLIRLIREKKSEQFARTLTEKLMTYAIGRGIEYYDRCAIDKILSETSKNDYRFKDLLLAIITSDPFQRKGTKNIDDTSDPISIDNKPSNKTTDAKNTSEAKP